VNKNILHYQKEFEDTKGGIRTFHLYSSSIYGVYSRACGATKPKVPSGKTIEVMDSA
jgi:hypothetical protein